MGYTDFIGNKENTSQVTRLNRGEMLRVTFDRVNVERN